jgi:hypothetical protein
MLIGIADLVSSRIVGRKSGSAREIRSAIVAVKHSWIRYIESLGHIPERIHPVGFFQRIAQRKALQAVERVIGEGLAPRSILQIYNSSNIAVI